MNQCDGLAIVAEIGAGIDVDQRQLAAVVMQLHRDRKHILAAVEVDRHLEVAPTLGATCGGAICRVTELDTAGAAIADLESHWAIGRRRGCGRYRGMWLQPRR